jgi:MFS family permease
LIYGLDLVGRPQTPYGISAAIVAVSIALGTVAVRHFRRHPHPLIDLSALRVPTFAITIWGASLFRIAIGATPFLLPLMFQVGFGMNAVTSGFLTLAVFAGNLLMKPATTPILRRFGFRTTMLYNGIFCAITFAACCFIFPDTPKYLIMAVLFVSGLSRSMQFTSLNTVGFADIPPSEMSAASTLSSTVQQVTFAMGVAFGAIALRIAGVVQGASGRTPTTADFHLAFGMVAVIALASIYDYFGLPANAGQEVSGQVTPPR